MRLTIKELENRLDTLKPHITARYYLSSKGKGVAPYIVYFSPSSDEDGADLKKFFSEDEFIIELYTKKKDTALENRVKALFPEFKVERNESEINGIVLNAFYIEAVNELGGIL